MNDDDSDEDADTNPPTALQWLRLVKPMYADTLTYVELLDGCIGNG
jgi:hypothetical protein